MECDERIERLTKALPYAKYVDIELSSLEKKESAQPYQKFFEELKNSPALPIISFHDFQSCPSDSELHALLKQMMQHSPAISKIAVTTSQKSEIEQLSDLCKNHPASLAPLAIMGMGTYGKESRLRLLSEGSALNYGYLCTPTAPGQCSVRELSSEKAKLLESA